MAYYRLYFMNAHTGSIARFDEFEAPGDAEAIDRADREAAAAPFELWCGAKKIYRLEASPQLPPGTLPSTGATSWRLGA